MSRIQEQILDGATVAPFRERYTNNPSAMCYPGAQQLLQSNNITPAKLSSTTRVPIRFGYILAWSSMYSERYRNTIHIISLKFVDMLIITRLLMALFKGPRIEADILWSNVLGMSCIEMTLLEMNLSI